MMAAYLKVIQKTLSHPDPSTNYVHEDALMAIGSLANGIFSQSIQLLWNKIVTTNLELSVVVMDEWLVLGMDFDKHMKDFHQIMYTALGNWQDYQVSRLNSSRIETSETIHLSYPNWWTLLFIVWNRCVIQVCNIAVGVVGDVARAIGTKLIPYCEKILTLLLNNLQVLV